METITFNSIGSFESRKVQSIHFNEDASLMLALFGTKYYLYKNVDDHIKQELELSVEDAEASVGGLFAEIIEKPNRENKENKPYPYIADVQVLEIDGDTITVDSVVLEEF
jgi:hypothetical protein